MVLLLTRLHRQQAVIADGTATAGGWGSRAATGACWLQLAAVVLQLLLPLLLLTPPSFTLSTHHQRTHLKI